MKTAPAWFATFMTSDDATTAPNDPDVASVERFIAAPPEAIFDILAHPARHREIDGSGTVRDLSDVATNDVRLTLGATFGMGMKAGLRYSMVNTVVEFEEGRRIAWQPRPSFKLARLLAGGRIWRYELEPRDGGTLVRETWDIRQEVSRRAVRPLRAKSVEAMTKTLAILEKVVTAPQG